MTRPLFDPSKMRQQQVAQQQPSQPQPQSQPPQPGAAVLTVSQLAGKIDVALRAALPVNLRVIGEVSGFRERTHWYFDLKDAESVVPCVMFQSATRRAGLTIANGLEVVITGRVDYYAKQGKVSFIVERLEPVGAGALDLAFRKLCDELRGLGWFAPERKRPLPTFPRRIAVITSRSAAALQDVLVTMRRRCPAVEVLLVDVRVQGDGSAPEVAAAIREVSRRARELRVDAVLVTRGGGSKEDLWAFNERIVAEAIVACEVPVVAAIGHETDTTIAELVADERCATPTQAATRLTPDAAALLRQLDSVGSRLAHGLKRGVREQVRGLSDASRHFGRAMHLRRQSTAARLDRLSARLERHRPAAIQARRAERLEAVHARLEAVMARRLGEVDLEASSKALSDAAMRSVREAKLRLEGAARQLKAVGPLGVLERGFTYTTREDGRLVRSIHDVQPGETIQTRVADGQLRSKVESDTPAPTRTSPATPPAPPSPAAAPSAPPAAERPIRRRPSDRSSDEPGLFSS